MEKKKRKQQNNMRIMTCLICPPNPWLIYIRVNRDSKSFSGSYSFSIQTAPIRRIPEFFFRNIIIIICFYLNCRLDIFSCTHFFVALMKIVNWSRCIHFAHCLTFTRRQFILFYSNYTCILTFLNKILIGDREWNMAENKIAEFRIFIIEFYERNSPFNWLGDIRSKGYQLLIHINSANSFFRLTFKSTIWRISKPEKWLSIIFFLQKSYRSSHFLTHKKKQRKIH